MSDAMKKVHKLVKVVEDEAKKVKLEVGQVAVLPGSPDQLVVTFIISEEAVEDEDTAAKRKLDNDFNSIVGGLGLEEIDSKTKGKLDDMDETLRKWQAGE